MPTKTASSPSSSLEVDERREIVVVTGRSVYELFIRNKVAADERASLNFRSIFLQDRRT